MRMTSIGHAGVLVETRQASIVCDPWFTPQYFGSWFVFPRNDALGDDLMGRIRSADYLYVSHLHADHFDAEFLRSAGVRHDVCVLLPDFPTDDLERALRGVGFTNLLRCPDGKAIDLGDGLSVTIHTQTALSDGPQGDSALLVDDGAQRMLNMNDCRLDDLEEVRRDGPIDALWLQFSGAIWYPMVYETTRAEQVALCRSKVESQFARAIRYVRDIGARAVVPCAGPPAFLDPDLFALNVLDGDAWEGAAGQVPSIFPDATEFIRRLAAAGIDTAHLVIPGSAVVAEPGTPVRVDHAVDAAEVRRPFDDKAAYLRAYADDWTSWLAAHRASWHAPTEGLLTELRRWWRPLLEMAPDTRAAIGANCLLRLRVPDAPQWDLDVLVDFPAGDVRTWKGEGYAFRFDIDRRLVETVVAERAVDWSNALFLSCRFRAWRAGGYNEYLYNFFKSLSKDRMRRAEAQVDADRARAAAPGEIRIGDYVVERFCPHRQADLTAFGALDADGHTLTCQLHGWRFDLRTGSCLTSPERRIACRAVTAD